MNDIEKSPIPPPTPEQMALIEQLGRDAYPRLADAERDALRAVLVYARLGVRVMERLGVHEPRGLDYTRERADAAIRGNRAAMGGDALNAARDLGLLAPPPEGGR